MSRKATINDMLNDLTFFTIYAGLKNLALNIFEWEGLPETMEGDFIEEALYENGQAFFFKDKKLGLLCLKCNEESGRNVYNRAIRYRVQGFNYNKTYSIDEGALIRNNKLKTNTHDKIILYTNKLCEIERTLDVNVKQCKTPYIVTCDEKDLLTFKNIFKQVDGNVPAIYADKNLNMNAVDILQTGVKFMGAELSDYRHDVTNEILTFLGINNANTDKRERLVTDEVNANNEVIMENIDYMYVERQKAVKKINEMFGLNVSVKIKNEPKEITSEETTEGDDE
jgi:hypothetical protein